MGKSGGAVRSFPGQIADRSWRSVRFDGRRPRQRVLKFRYPAPLALFGGFAQDSAPAIILASYLFGRPHDRSLTNDGDKSSNSQFGTLLQHPLHLVAFEYTLVEGDLGLGLTCRRLLRQHSTCCTLCANRLHLCDVFVAVSVQQDEGITRLYTQHARQLAADRCQIHLVTYVHRLTRQEKAMHELQTTKKNGTASYKESPTLARLVDNNNGGANRRKRNRG